MQRNLTCALATTLTMVLVTFAMAEPEDKGIREETRRIISRHKAVFNTPPKRIPSDTAVDAPLLGNGDIGVAIGGPPESQTFWLAKNDFWRLQNRYGGAMPQVFGRIQVEMPAIKGARYEVAHELYEPVTVSTFTKAGITVQIRAWVAATDNVLVVELRSSGAATPVEVRLLVQESDRSEEHAGQDGALHWIERKFTQDVDIPVAAACAMGIAGADATAFTLEPETPVTLVAVLYSSFQDPEYLQTAQQHLLGIRKNDPDLSRLRQDHAAWWADFWAKSYVALDDPDIERHYYLSNYVMGSCSRNPEFPPPIFGTWNTTDTPAWFGDYHLNYNHMAPFYGLYSSNHLEQADPYHAPILAFIERGQWYAREVLGCRGVLYPVGIGPKGIETTRNCPDYPDHIEKGGLFFGQKSNAAYAVVNLSMRWYRTYDPAYAKTVYPFVREVADFWEDYLKFQNGRYVIYKDAVHEGSGKNFNSIVSLGLVRNLFETALDMSTALALGVERHAQWQHILDHLSAFATQEKRGKTVFRYTERGTDWWRDNTLGIQHIYPAGAIGLDSDPELLAIARNTLEVMNRWVDNNGMNSFFPAAVRVGYDPEVIYERLRTYVLKHANANGFAAHNPHGIENCSIVPNTINEMLCMGHQAVLRVFPVWPKDRDARFAGLRAEGAFLVSSELRDGVVQYVRLLSERGRTCTFENPWPKEPVTLERNGQRAEQLAGKRFAFPTGEDEVIALVPAGTR